MDTSALDTGVMRPTRTPIISPYPGKVYYNADYALHHSYKQCLFCFVAVAYLVDSKNILQAAMARGSMISMAGASVK
ncbi:hypothetical protein J1614_010012 [Plenodomus biglobosus]|nr:hypothetical protein J1614_010012 [Plenodomus biglobosus]